MDIHTPDWVKHSVFYQIFPDRFAQGQPTFHGLTFQPWAADPTLYGYKGGNLRGVIEKLDYLKDLGINAIYFTPIFQSASNHRYHTHDYYQVDPLLGGNEAFLALLKAAHAKEIKVVLDGVFNHASRGFFFFHDLLENGLHSPYQDWFKIEGWPLSPYDGDRPANYVSWDNNRALPEFNHDHPPVREYLMQVAEYWIGQGIDGWRLDVPFCIQTPGFWQEFRARVKQINPEAYIVGEVWENAEAWLDGTQFDGVMNYPFAAHTIAFTAGDRVDLGQVKSVSYRPYPALFATEYGERIQALLQQYPWAIQLTQLNLLASHDTARLMTIAGGDAASVELATLLLMTFPGAPSIYYGDEVGLPGALDPDSRRGFPPENQWRQDILTCHCTLIALRHRYAALRVGDYQVCYAQGAVYAFWRILGEQALLIALNAGTEPAQITLTVPEGLTIQYGKGRQQGSNLDLPARSGMVFGPEVV
ncbi:glycoside hydrolase family 13 protein [Candidatus Cyanaurora vandensis]|uniref:glycoside hydrolase family 13 protein n=1 Tax=Candidatus Cyanaurora vandensis TaxID=2714958 RepID=UPI00257B914E|nr:glycoside hydrolase family 13 protein [Candidatus Cyanaurora vandensis]